MYRVYWGGYERASACAVFHFGMLARHPPPLTTPYEQTRIKNRGAISSIARPVKANAKKAGESEVVGARWKKRKEASDPGHGEKGGIIITSPLDELKV